MNKDYVTKNEFNSKFAKVYKTNVIYDCNSDDINVNWEKPDGITPVDATGVTITNKDFSKYKKLKIVCGNNLSYIYGTSYCFEVDLTKLINGVYRGVCITSSPYVPIFSASEIQDIRKAVVTISADKNTLTFYSVFTSNASSSEYVFWTESILKIEGVS